MDYLLQSLKTIVEIIAIFITLNIKEGDQVVPRFLLHQKDLDKIFLFLTFLILELRFRTRKEYRVHRSQRVSGNIRSCNFKMDHWVFKAIEKQIMPIDRVFYEHDLQHKGSLAFYDFTILKEFFLECPCQTKNLRGPLI